MTNLGKTTAALVLVGTLTACGPAPSTHETATPMSCAAGDLKAEGSTAQTGAINIWIRNYQVSCPDASIGYASTGSGAGIADFVTKAPIAFVGSDFPLSPADQAKANARCGTGPAIHLPMVVGPIALAYNIAGVADLRLTPTTVAKIFAGAITTWNDKTIAADNPGATLPSTPIIPVHRLDNSGTTDNFTKFLSAGGAWSSGHTTAWPGATGTAETGNDGVATAVAETDGAIGYVEWSYALFRDLHTARIGNGAHQFVAPGTDAAAKTLAGAKNTDLQITVDYTTTAPGAYPIVLVTYEIACQRGSPALLKSFLTYTSSPSGQAAVTRLGYAPLPEDLRRKVATAVHALS